MTLKPSDFVGLDPVAKWSRLLSGAYGVSDRRIARMYLARCELLGLTVEQGLLAGLRIAPVAEFSTRASGRVEPKLIADLSRRLKHTSAMIRDRVRHSARSRLESGDGDDAESLASFSHRRTHKDWSAYFMSERTDRSVAEFGRVSKMNGRHVIIVRSRDLGTFVGPGMTFQGGTRQDGLLEFPPGWVLFGPKATFSEGEYDLEVDLDGPPDGDILLDIVSHLGLRKIFEIRLFGSAKLRFSITIAPSDRDVEIRIVNLKGEPRPYQVNSLLLTLRAG